MDTLLTGIAIGIVFSGYLLLVLMAGGIVRFTVTKENR